ncbi:MAG: hypothetical protein DME34_03440 [Verrucomicrobia bacterium]|nr:MAG: hypothetical protein DME34_03440 [Verrucomicrobiota bacterium]
MPRKIKTNEATKNGTTAPSLNSEPKKRRPAKLVRKKTTAGARRTKPGAKSIPPTSAAEPFDEMVRTRAYFIAERRHRLGLPGDASSDWLEAKRQLVSELGPR